MMEEQIRPPTFTPYSPDDRSKYLTPLEAFNAGFKDIQPVPNPPFEPTELDHLKKRVLDLEDEVAWLREYVGELGEIAFGEDPE